MKTKDLQFDSLRHGGCFCFWRQIIGYQNNYYAKKKCYFLLFERKRVVFLRSQLRIVHAILGGYEQPKAI